MSKQWNMSKQSWKLHLFVSPKLHWTELRRFVAQKETSTKLNWAKCTHFSLLCLVYSGVLELRKCRVKSAQLPLLQSKGFGISELPAVKKYAVQWSTQHNETQSILTLPFIWFTERDYCHSHPCRHNGTCHNLPNDYKCECPSGLTGINCEG